MDPLTPKEVDHIAQLAYIKLSDEESEDMRSQWIRTMFSETLPTAMANSYEFAQFWNKAALDSPRFLRIYLF
jgi:hypothetical protein